MKNKTFSIKSLVNTDQNDQTVIFEGDLGVKNAVAIKKSVQLLKFSYDSVILHLKNVEKFDITSIQIIRAMKIHLSKNGIKTTMINELPDEIGLLLNNTGFGKFL